METQARGSNLERLVLQLVLVIAITAILYYGKSLLLPLALASILAMLLDPIHEKLLSWGLPNGLAIAGALMVLLLFFGGLFLAVGQQTNRFVEEWPKIEERLTEQYKELNKAVGFSNSSGSSDSTSVSATPQKLMGGSSIGGATSSILNTFPGGGGQIFAALGNIVSFAGDFLLMLIYVALLLAQKDRLREFVLRRAPDEDRGKTHEIINRSANVVQSYLKGRLIIIVILAVLYAIGFSISGLDFALLVAVLVAVLSLIPYIGNIIGAFIAMALAFAGGGDTNTLIGVLVTMSVAQLLENYALTPFIVGDEVDLNPLITIVCVIGITILWGPIGAIVAIPLFAMLRIFFKNVDGLKDFAYLLGTE